MIKTIFLNALSIYFLSLIFTGLKFDSLLTLVQAAIILGLLNTFVKPILSLLTLPINLVTFGLFSLVLNIFILFLVTKMVPGFKLAPFTLGGVPYLPPLGIDRVGALFLASVSLNFLNSLFWYFL